MAYFNITISDLGDLEDLISLLTFMTSPIWYISFSGSGCRQFAGTGHSGGKWGT